MKMICDILLILLSGLFYYLGGQGGAWYKRSWIRDYLCPIIVCAFLAHSGFWHKSLFICYPLMVCALSTYWKKKGTDAQWYNWFLHGLGIGLALIPYGIYIHSLNAILCRAIILGISMAVWSHFIHKDWLDEGGRGSLIIATLYLF